MSTLVEDLWARQSAWSQLATAMKNRLARARLAGLHLVGIAAVAGAIAASLTAAAPGPARWFAGTAALASALVPVLRRRWSGATLTDWSRARSVSEALKSEVYLVLAGVRTEDEARSRIETVREDAADLAPRLAPFTPVARPLPAVRDPTSYFAVRVAGQIDDYYDPRARHYGRVLRRFHAVETALGVLGTVIGVVAALTTTSLAAWIAVVAALGTAVATHVAATRYEYQMIEFLRTAERLRSLRDQAARATLGNDLRQLVTRAEDAISVENQAWMAKVSEEPPDHEIAS